MSFGYITPSITKWKLNDFMCVIDGFEDEIANKTHGDFCIGNDYKTILLHIVGKSILTTREALTLCAHGYSDGALSLGRNLYEQMMIMEFFELHKNDNDFDRYVNDFILSYEVQRNKYLRDSAKYLHEIDTAEYNKSLNELKKCTDSKISGDYWWSGCEHFSDLVSDVMNGENNDKVHRFLGIQYARYKRACISLHASCIGNSNRLGTDTGLGIIDTSPDLYRQSSPLMFAVVSIICIIGTVCSYFQMDGSNYLKPLNELAAFYQKEENNNCSNNGK
jgi:hypothetical protein